MNADQFEGYAEHYAAEARLIILKALADQNDYRLNDKMLTTVLQQFAINRGRDFTRNQLSWLEENASAVKLIRAGTAIVAELTEAGLDHVERRTVLHGVARPSPARS
ncbi:VpaChn25_0724 family phage protein [Oceaniradius stylonematis]|uniref:VpaChn25_0724 family phage protein n=1 Tax=Oceaniradius stylonematis TaxID=2184161 RepID=UPI00273EF7A1|nr:hypothetical protein [Oceaniradius stylonematis]MCR9122990.1 hypothetical protein [Phyllobacteriaceae bacterium]